MLAWVFHWPPESIYNLEADDLIFWTARVEEIEKTLRSKNGKNKQV